jgi:ubiquinol oxidase
VSSPHKPQTDKSAEKTPAALAADGKGLPSYIPPRKDPDIKNDMHWHHENKTLSDHFAAAAVKTLRFVGDKFFGERYASRAIVLETVAAVPGMVGSMHNHLLSLRRMKHDNGLVRMLMDEAENERMHLMTFVEVGKPTLLERMMITATQVAFLGFFSLAYTFNKRTAHRFIGLLEEEAVRSYTHYLDAIDAGKVENIDAPQIAKDYWKLKDDAKLRDVVLAVRADEAEHRDVNHGCADKLDQVIAQRREEKRQRKIEKQAKKPVPGYEKVEKAAQATLRRAAKIGPKP